MKPALKILFGSIFLAGVGFGLSGCVSDGYVSGGEVYYGPEPGPWFNDGPWFYGHRERRYPPGAYIHPPHFPHSHPPGHGPNHRNDHGPGHPPDHHPNPGGHPSPSGHGPDHHDRDHH